MTPPPIKTGYHAGHARAWSYVANQRGGRKAAEAGRDQVTTGEGGAVSGGGRRRRAHLKTKQQT